MTKKLVFLDYDGVICDSKKSFFDGVEYVSQMMNLGLSREVCESSKTREDFECILSSVWDSNVDFWAAKNANIPFVWVESWVNSKNDWEALSIKSIPNLTHLPEYLKNTWN